jgi:hypothetical protein
MFVHFQRVMSQARERLPVMQIRSDATRNKRAVESKERRGIRGLHKKVKMGENRKIGRVFLPINSIPSRSLPVIYG